MRCSPNEYTEAVHEGTKVEFQWSSKEVIRDGSGKMTGLKIIQMQRKVKGEDGWNHAIPFMRYKELPGTEKVINADMVIAAIGQTTDMNGLEKTVSEKSPFLQVDMNFEVKGMPGVFGGGDAYKIDLITTAIGQGRKAAESIDYYVNGREYPMKHRDDVIKFSELKSDYFVKTPAPKRTMRHPASVVGNYDEVLEKLEDGTALKEAERCMSCGLCFECRQCMMYCPQEAIAMFKKNPIGEVMYTDYTRCIGCHICAEVCPSGYIDMAMGQDL
jgi:NADPH-dependent glutamate synthase beta subunit-like oxidoreductase